jgi:hypothetical protein
MAKAEMRLKNRDRWTEALDALPAPRPVSATWAGRDAVLSLLAPFAESGCNHFLLPTGGGMDVASVRPSREPSCIELVIRERTAYVVRPERVTLEHFPEAPLESFLLVELGELAPTGVYEELARPMEELVEADGDYVERSHWDEGSLGEDEAGRPLPLPNDARLIVRFLGGKIMVVSKGSLWNGVPATYDGRHSRMTADELRRQIADALARLGPDYLERQLAAD